MLTNFEDSYILSYFWGYKNIFGTYTLFAMAYSAQ